MPVVFGFDSAGLFKFYIAFECVAVFQAEPDRSGFEVPLVTI